MKKNMRCAVVAAGVCLMLVAGCGTKDTNVAVIGKQKVGLKAVAERLQDAPPAYQSYLNTSAGRKQFVDLMVREKVVLEAARRAGVKGRAEYKKAIADFKKEQARRVKEYEDSLLMELYVRELQEKDLAVTDKDVEAFYTQNQAEYQQPRAIVARHILVPSQEEADKVLARLKAGEDFAKVAKEVSSDPISAMRGGEIGPFKKGDLVPEFEQAVFPLKPGETSGAVKTQFGFHIIKKVSEQALPAMKPEEAKLEIKKTLEKQKLDSWFEKTKASLGVKVNYDALSKMPVMKETEMPGAALEGAGKPDAPQDAVQPGK